MTAWNLTRCMYLKMSHTFEMTAIIFKESVTLNYINNSLNGAVSCSIAIVKLQYNEVLVVKVKRHNQRVYVLRETLIKIHISCDVTMCRVIISYRCSEAWNECSEFNFGVKLYPSLTSWPWRRHYFYSVTNHSSRRHNIPEECIEYLL